MFGTGTQVCYNMKESFPNDICMGERHMFTRSSARNAIGNPAAFARGSAYVQEGKVEKVTVRQQDALLIYEGIVHGPGED